MAALGAGRVSLSRQHVLGVYLALGIMVPIRLGSVSILQLIVDLNLVNTLTALILVYTAQSLPLAIFILTEFMRQIPTDLKEAARCDGINEYRIFFWVVLPLTWPAIATVAVFTMVPIWNDLWFPLILRPATANRPSPWACSSSSASTSPTGTRCWPRSPSRLFRSWSSMFSSRAS